MTNALLMRVAFAGAVVAAPVGALIGQPGWIPGSEIAGQTLQVQTQGVTNSIYFGADGTATITTPQGSTVPGTWSAANNMLCVSANAIQECWPYTQPFQAGQQVALTSNCNQVSTFLAQATNPPVQEPAGERG